MEARGVEPLSENPEHQVSTRLVPYKVSPLPYGPETGWVSASPPLVSPQSQRTVLFGYPANIAPHPVQQEKIGGTAVS